MIETGTELRVAVRQLQILEHALQALRNQLGWDNPWLLEVTESSYIRRVGSLRADIISFLGEHREALSLVLPPFEPAAVTSDADTG